MIEHDLEQRLRDYLHAEVDPDSASRDLHAAVLAIPELSPARRLGSSRILVLLVAALLVALLAASAIAVGSGLVHLPWDGRSQHQQFSSNASPAPSAHAPITNFGATREAWNLTHIVDPYAAPNTAFDPWPGLSPGNLPEDKYVAVIPEGRVTSYSERLYMGSTFADARVAALAELPPDGTVLWTNQLGTCAQLELQSARLGSAMADNGMVFVEVVTETATGDSGYNPSDANLLIFMLRDYPTASDAPAC